MSFHIKLARLLKTDPRFVDVDGKIVIAAVQDHAWKVDRNLVKLLLSDREMIDTFFEKREGRWIFNLNTFLVYVSQKNVHVPVNSAASCGDFQNSELCIKPNWIGGL